MHGSPLLRERVLVDRIESLTRVENLAGQNFDDERFQAVLFRFYASQDLVDFIAIDSFHVAAGGVGK